MRKVFWLFSFVMLGLLPRYALAQAPLLPLKAGDQTRLWLQRRPMLNTVVSTHPDSIVVLDGAGTTWTISAGNGFPYRIASRSGLSEPQVYSLTRLEVNGGLHAYGPGKGMLIGAAVGAASAGLVRSLRPVRELTELQALIPRPKRGQVASLSRPQCWVALSEVPLAGSSDGEPLPGGSRSFLRRRADATKSSSDVEAPPSKLKDRADGRCQSTNIGRFQDSLGVEYVEGYEIEME